MATVRAKCVSFEKHRKVVLNSGAGESTDEVKQQRVAALSAWKTKRVFHTKPQATSCKQTSHLCLRGDLHVGGDS